MTFDQAVNLNIPHAPKVADTPVNNIMWLDVLVDLATSIYRWESDYITPTETQRIEDWIFHRRDFAAIQTVRKVGNALVKGGVHILPCSFTWDNAGSSIRHVTEVQINDYGWDGLQHRYSLADGDVFVPFINNSRTIPIRVADKYAEMLTILDQLYHQNVDKLSMPVIALTEKNNKNEFVNLFKRTALRAMFTFFNSNLSQQGTGDLFYHPDIEYILDKVTTERHSIMREYLEQIGVNTVDITGKSQYVNRDTVHEDSLVSKYFALVLNKYRDSFVERIQRKMGITLVWKPTINDNVLVADDREGTETSVKEDGYGANKSGGS